MHLPICPLGLGYAAEQAVLPVHLPSLHFLFLMMLPSSLPAEAGVSPSARAALLHEWEEHEAQLLDSGMPEEAGFELPGTVLIPPAEKSVIDEVWSRGRWLLGLLVLQSTSSFVLDSYQQVPAAACFPCSACSATSYLP